MPTFRHSSTQEIREIPQEIIDAWTATSNPKLTAWIPYVFTAQPAFNAATQKVVQIADVLANNTYTQSWQVIALNAGELAAVADAAEMATLKTAIAVFDARTATNTQIQRAIAYLLKKTA